MKKKIAVLISNGGKGTNLQGLIDSIERSQINGEIAVVISDTKEAFGLERAKKHHIKTLIVSSGDDLIKTLKEKYKIDFIALAGWKKIITEETIDAFRGRILNIHPGLIPDTPEGFVTNPDGTKGVWNKGKYTTKAVQNFLDSKATYAGSTVHILTKEFDFGPVLERCFEKVRSGDTVDSLYKRLKVKENKIFAKAMEKLCKERDNSKQRTVLVVDMAGRGAALVHRYAQSKKVKRVLAIPGNDLMELYTKKEVKTYPELSTTSVKEIIEICRKEKVDFVDVAQDNAVEAGVTDAIEEIGIPVIGPTKTAGQIEWDKAWARDFMKKYNIPHPRYQICRSEEEGMRFIKSQKEGKWFVKASGLIGGKGALPAENNKRAVERIKEMKKMGKAGETFVIEEWLEGEEFSLFALCDGKTYKLIGCAQDHKRMYTGDLGENTGGMGCSTPPLILTKELLKQADKEIMKKTIEGLQKEGRDYKGVLYLGGIVVKGKVYVIEFNARWGDPEAEVIIPGIKNDLLEISEAVAFQTLDKLILRQDNLSRVSVALSLREHPVGDPGKYGRRIFGIKEALKIPGVILYGTRIKVVDGKYYAGTGRLLHIVGEGKNVIEAREKAYQAAGLFYIEGNNLHYRTDIGWRDVERLTSS